MRLECDIESVDEADDFDVLSTQKSSTRPPGTSVSARRKLSKKPPGNPGDTRKELKA